MDICSHIGSSVSDDVNSLHELFVDPLVSSHRVVGEFSVDDLGNGINESLNIQDDQEWVSGSILPSGKHEIEKEYICGASLQGKLTTVTSEKCLSKSATFPGSSKNSSSASASIGRGVEGEAKDGVNDITTEVLAQNDNAKYVTPPCLRSKSLPTPLKLVSALKGSRQKQGAPPKKLTVKWAPDVYDPTPTAVSHVVTNKSQRHNKKNAKNKQKGKTSRGSKGKDKKQARKHGGSSNRGFKLLDYDEKVVDFGDPQPTVVDFSVGSSDPHCGSSFLKSITSLHFSLAEAT